MARIIKESAGNKYGFWSVIAFDKIDSHHDARWWCKCESCGRIYSVKGFTLRNGQSKHCRYCNNKGCDE